MTEVVIKRDGNGDPTDHLYRLTVDPMSALSVLCGRRDIQRGVWASKLGVPLSLDDRVVKAVGTAILALATDAPWMESKPTWSENSLHMPSGKSAPAGYGVTVGQEEDARENWLRACTLLAQAGNEKGALYIGAGLGGIYVRRFDRQSAIWHACGKSSGGKTSCMVAAASLFGPPDKVKKSWAMTAIAATASLMKLGVLTAFRDEGARMGRKTPREMETMLFDVTEGGDRERTHRETGDTYTLGTWFGNMLSNGNDSLLDMATDNGGLNARVMELTAPLTNSKEASDKLVVLTKNSAGWPFKWLRDQITPADAWKHFAQAERDLGVELLDGVPGRIGKALSTGVAGASLLEELTGSEGLRASALRAARAALENLVAEAAGIAMEPGEKLLNAVVEAVASEPASFPDRGVYTSPVGPEYPLRNVMGVTYTEGPERRIAVFATKLKVIAEGAGIVSPRTGLRDLRNDGVLVPEEHDSRKGLTRRESLGETGRVSCYVFRRPQDEPPKPAFVAEPSPAVVEEPLPPEPPLPFDLRPEGTPADVAPAVAAVAPVAAVSAPVVAEAAPVPDSPAVPPARSAQHTARVKTPQRVEVRAVTSAGLFDPAAGSFVALEGAALQELPALVDLVASAAGGRHVTLVLDDEVLGRYGLTGPRPTQGKPWHKAFEGLVKAGWHQPRKAEERPRVQPTTSLEHPERNGHVRLTVAAWLRPQEFPKGPKGESAGAVEMAFRLFRYAELTGWAFTSTAANTSIWALRGLLEETSKSWPRFIPQRSQEWPDWQAADSWSRSMTAEERGMGYVIGYDAIKNYLPAYGAAIVAGEELEHDRSPVFDEKRGGLWLMTVPEWPHVQVPAPVHEVPAGKMVWVTTAIVKSYVEVGINPEVHEAWTAPAVAFEGFRAFTRTLRDALAKVETSGADDPDEMLVRDALKSTYRMLHGKLRNDDQWVIRRPDWGYAVRDAAWTGVLRKVYKGAGLLGQVETPRFPIAVDTDEVVYPSGCEDPRSAVPAGLTLAKVDEPGNLGQFRPKTAMTTQEWEETNA
ncbi:DUF927 domain-containing protein [Streptomyces erythrochromogenes]|uniref:DUF927 domain-containing protein n=1 Tax=Streptomyces erythrochromogenes TaxID=285574 RepID=UPI003430AFE7